MRIIALAAKKAPPFNRCLLRQCGKITQKAIFSAIGEASDPSDVFQLYCQHNIEGVFNEEKYFGDSLPLWLFCLGKEVKMRFFNATHWTEGDEG